MTAFYVPGDQLYAEPSIYLAGRTGIVSLKPDHPGDHTCPCQLRNSHGGDAWPTLMPDGSPVGDAMRWVPADDPDPAPAPATGCGDPLCACEPETAASMDAWRIPFASPA